MSDTNPLCHRFDGINSTSTMRCVELDTSLDGLTSDEADRRLDEFGPNEITESASISPLRLIWAQISSVMVLILIGAAALSLALGKLLEAGAIAAIVVLFAAARLRPGVPRRASDRRAATDERARWSAPAGTAAVVEVPSAELVPGDVVMLDAGAIVPADLRLLEAASLRVEEAALTGESEPVDKQIDAVEAAETSRSAIGAAWPTAARRSRPVGASAWSSRPGCRPNSARSPPCCRTSTGRTRRCRQRLDRVGKQLAAAGVVVAALVAVMGALAGESRPPISCSRRSASRSP